MAILTVVPLAWVVVLLVSFAWIEAQSARAVALERRSAVVIIQCQHLLGVLGAAELGARGYVATGEARFTKPYEAATTLVPGILAKLRLSLADEPKQRIALNSVRVAASSKLAATREEIAAMASGRPWRAAQLSSASATGGMERVRRAIENVEAREVAANTAGSNTAFALWSRWAILLIVGTALVAAITVLLNKLFTDGVVKRLALLAEEIVRLRKGETFTARVGGKDEVTAVEDEVVRLTIDVAQRQGTLERYRLLSDVTTDLIIFVDRMTLRIIEANEAAARAYGYPREQMSSLTVQDLCAPDVPSMYSTTVPTDGSGGAILFESTHRRSDGTTFPVEVASQNAKIDGQRVIISTIRDITERQRAAEEVSLLLKQALEASRLKTEFVATMSHEIRTPMNGVMGMIDVLLHTDLTEAQRDFAFTVKESADSLMVIINDILDFSKLEAGRVDLEAIDFDLAHLIESVAELLRTSAAKKGITISVQISRVVPPRLSGDPGRLRQILMNLVGNAVKFTERGSVAISAVVETESDDGLVLRFSVADTGMGIPTEAHGRLFQPFVQADGTTTRRFGGTGLGLSISRSLVELMGGRIEAESTEGVGSTFTFTARLQRALASPDAAEPAVAERGRLLIVDDDPDFRALLLCYASAWGFAVRYVADAHAALTALTDARAEGRPYDVVLTDYILPDVDGFGLIRMIRDELQSAAPALVMMTAFDAASPREQAVAHGCAGYFVKPIVPSNLYDLLCSVVKEREAARLPSAVPTTGRMVEARERGNIRILLAEDTPTNQRVVKFQIERLGYALDVVNDGREAVEAVKSTSYDLVLMDCQMPVMDGYNATRRIREHEVETGGHLTIVALTANALERDRQACLDAGMDDYLAKPLEFNALREMLERLLQSTGAVEEKVG